jgi:hypothetical protein
MQPPSPRTQDALERLEKDWVERVRELSREIEDDKITEVVFTLLKRIGVSQQELAEELGYRLPSGNTIVSETKRGKRRNDDVIDLAIAMIRRRGGAKVFYDSILEALTKNAPAG